MMEKGALDEAVSNASPIITLTLTSTSATYPGQRMNGTSHCYHLPVLNVNQNSHKNSKTISIDSCKTEQRLCLGCKRSYAKCDNPVSKSACDKVNDVFGLDMLANSVTGITGLKEAVTSKNGILKHLWRFMFIFGLVATIYFLYATTNEYLANPTLTKVRLKRESSYDYPPIVLCNDAWFDFEKANRLGLSKDAFQYSLGYTHWHDRPESIPVNITQAQTEFIDFFNTKGYQGLLDYYLNISTDLRAVFSKEQFLNSTRPSYLATSVGLHMRKVFLPLNSICYAFYLPPVQGRMGALFEKESIQLKFIDSTGGRTSISRNWHLYLASDEVSLYSWPLIVRPFSNNMLTIKAQRFIFLNKTRSPCCPKEFTAAACMADCGSRLYRQLVNCIPFWLTSSEYKGNLTDLCNDFDTNSSDDSFLPNTMNKRMGVVLAESKESCFSKCHRRCERTLYEAKLEEEPWMGEGEEEGEMSGNMSMVIIQVVHDSMRQDGILVIEEVRTYTFTELVTNVGGMLGLFVGATLLTVAEVVMFYVERCFWKENGKNHEHPDKKMAMSA